MADSVPQTSTGATPTQSVKPSGVVTLLSIMMFLQFFAWGAWFATLAAALDTAALGSFIGAAYACGPIAAIIAPLFLGLIADRLFASEKIFGVLMLVAAGLMFAIPGVATDASGFAKSSAETDSGIDGSRRHFYGRCIFERIHQDAAGTEHGRIDSCLADPRPSVVLHADSGTGQHDCIHTYPKSATFPEEFACGERLAGSWLAWPLGSRAGRTASISSGWARGARMLLGLFCFALPHTPPPLKGQPMDLRSLFMVDAFKLLGDFNFLIFAICSTLICVPLAYYYGMTSTFLSQTGFSQAAATMTIGQMSEIFFMLLIPFFFRKLGLKMMIVIGMACWVVRYALFAFGAAPSKLPGCCCSRWPCTVSATTSSSSPVSCTQTRKLHGHSRSGSKSAGLSDAGRRDVLWI